MDLEQNSEQRTAPSSYKETGEKASNNLTVSPPSLFEHITTLVSGLIALGLLSFTGYTLLDYWLGDNSNPSFFNSYLYSFYLYLLFGLLLFTALHLWMHARNEQKMTPALDPSLPVQRTARAFSAVFLTILTVMVVSNIVALLYIGGDAALGTADYSVKGLWKALLGPLQAGLWAMLLCWYFQGIGKGRSTRIYIITAGLISLAVAGLLLAFPLLAKRGAVIDSRTSSDLTSISLAINEFAGKNNKLPETLDELGLDDKTKSRLNGYEYQKAENSHQDSSSAVKPFLRESLGSEDSRDILRAPGARFAYKLCADFKTDTTKNNDRSPIPLLTTSSDFNSHPAGRHCFDRTAYGRVNQPAASDTPVFEPSEESL